MTSLPVSLATHAAVAELRGLPLFGELSEEELVIFTHGLERRHFAQGESLFRQGERAESAFLIVEGEAEILSRLPGGEELAVATVGPGELVGEMSLLGDGARSASVRFTRPTSGFMMSQRFFRASIAQHDAAAFCITRHISRLVAMRLRSLNAQIVSLASMHATEGLATPEPGRRDVGPGREPDFEVTDFLPRLAIFRELGARDIARLLRRGRVVTLSAGVRLFAEGDPASTLLVVLRGALAMSCSQQGRRYALEVVGPGKVCGLDDVLASSARARACQAVSETTVFELDAAAFRELEAQQSWLSHCFQQALCDALLESLARANRRLAHEVTRTAMAESQPISSVSGRLRS